MPSITITKPRFSLLFVVLAVSVVFGTEIVTIRYFLRHTLRSDLPDIVLAERGKFTIAGSFSRPYNFTSDWFTMNIPCWRIALNDYKNKPVNYLEVGAYEGMSLIWLLENILTHPDCNVTAIDIFDGDYRDRYYQNIRLAGRDVTTIEDYSQLALRKLTLDSFDIIYIDGSHDKCDVLEDAVLSWRLLKKGGILIFDDYQYLDRSTLTDNQKAFPKVAIDAFAQCFSDRFEVVHNDYQLILRKN